jgi:hypothetical protein
MRARWVAILGLWLTSACGSSTKLLGHPVHHPIAIVVRVSDEVANSDDGGAIASMVDAMLEGLRERGLEGQVYAAPDEHPPPPRIDIRVQTADPGSAGRRKGGELTTVAGALGRAPIVGLAGVAISLSGAGSVKIDCWVYEEGKSRPSFHDSYSRVLLGDADAAASAGESLGNAIMSSVFRNSPPDESEIPPDGVPPSPAGPQTQPSVPATVAMPSTRPPAAPTSSATTTSRPPITEPRPSPSNSGSCSAAPPTASFDVDDPSGAPAASASATSTPAPDDDSPAAPKGRLPPEVIQARVREHYGEFRRCYEAALARNPALKGRVSARFVIGRDGSVSNVSDGGSDLPDPVAVKCVLSKFYGISFPAPRDGIVVVVYPIMLEPG